MLFINEMKPCSTTLPLTHCKQCSTGLSITTTLTINYYYHSLQAAVLFDAYAYALRGLLAWRAWGAQPLPNGATDTAQGSAAGRRCDAACLPGGLRGRRGAKATTPP